MVPINSSCTNGGPHLWFFSDQNEAAHCTNCKAKLDPASGPVTPEMLANRPLSPKKESALEWYAEQAEALKRYTEANPPQVDGIAAVVAALALDGGRRGGKL